MANQSYQVLKEEETIVVEVSNDSVPYLANVLINDCRMDDSMGKQLWPNDQCEYSSFVPKEPIQIVVQTSINESPKECVSQDVVNFDKFFQVMSVDVILELEGFDALVDGITQNTACWWM